MPDIFSARARHVSHYSGCRRTTVCFAILASARAQLGAQATPPAKPDTAVTLGAIKITAERADQTRVDALQRLTLPATASITAARAERTINVVDPEDMVKYLPSVFLR